MYDEKPIHARPSLYALCFFDLKKIALKYGYNLVLHGSLHRDLDLIAIPWQEKVKDSEKMIKEFAKVLGGYVMKCYADKLYIDKPHGRKCYVINLNRGEKSKKGEYKDPQYYLDISVMPVTT
ncbi:MAG: hypothetical protein K0S44_234 [Bacteroidetes bacterium]|jgi:hypothetical protein|nr:hypothetical protein [Bacteroidota bacterium]